MSRFYASSFAPRSAFGPVWPPPPPFIIPLLFDYTFVHVVCDNSMRSCK